MVILGIIIVIFSFFIGFKMGQADASITIIDSNTGKKRKYDYWPGHEYYSYLDPNHHDE